MDLIVELIKNAWKFFITNAGAIKDLSFIFFGVVGLPLLVSRTLSANMNAKAAKEKTISDRYTSALKLLEHKSTYVRTAAIRDLESISNQHRKYINSVIKITLTFIKQRCYIPYDYDLSFTEAVKVLNVGRSTLSNLIKKGEIRSKKIKGRWRISKSSVENQLAKKKTFIPKYDPESNIDKNSAFRLIGTCSGYKDLDPSDRAFQNVSFRKCSLNRLSFRDSELFDCDFSETNCQISDLSSCYFYRCTFKNSYLGASKLTDSNFHKCTFNNTQFRLKGHNVPKYEPKKRLAKYLYDLTLGRMYECIATRALFEECVFDKCDLQYVIGIADKSFKKSKLSDEVLLPKHVRI